jgi:hypothetical protein
MSSASANESPGDQGAGDRDQRAEEVKLFVTTSVKKFADETADWMKESADAFNACFEKALKGEPKGDNGQPRGYTADELVKDMADMWARNVKYLARLARIGVPDDGGGGKTAAEG